MAAVGEEMVSSPTNRVKFLCSYGGKILPRPSDGHLKYVGGETRVIAIPRDITFSELMHKLRTVFNSDVILKYQLIPEDLDALISVTCDEDLKNMFDEYNLDNYERLINGRSPRIRAFLFPSTRVTADAHISGNAADPAGLEQRYIEAINGIVRSNSDLGHFTYNLSSSSSSQNSITPDDGSSELSDAISRCCRVLPRVNSSPNLLSSGQQQQGYQQPRVGRPLMTAQSDVARYNIDQLARKYSIVRHGSSELIGFGQPNGHNAHRSGGSVEKEKVLHKPMKQRWGSPLKRTSSRQD